MVTMPNLVALSQTVGPMHVGIGIAKNIRDYGLVNSSPSVTVLHSDLHIIRQTLHHTVCRCILLVWYGITVCTVHAER